MSDIKTPAELTAFLKSQIASDDVVDESLYRYVIYARKSTDADDKQANSLDDQIAECEQLVTKYSLKVVKIFRESVSAKEPDIRPQFREMLDGLYKGRYDGVIAYHPNRLSRNMKEAGEVIDMLDKHIIKDLKFPSYTHNNDSSGKMLLAVTFAMSKQYSDDLSRVVSRGIESNIALGRYINKAKAGYVKDRNGFLVPDGRNFSLIADVFKMRFDGYTNQEAADYLNGNGFTRTNTRKGKKYEKHATKSMVGKIINDPVYAGVVMYGKHVANLTEIEGYDFVPAVEVSTFMAINNIKDEKGLISLARRHKRKGSVKADLMRNKIICSECGNTKLGGITSKKIKEGKRHYYYYRCEDDGCRLQNKSTRAKVFVDFAIDYFKQKPFSSIESYQHYQEEMERVQQQRVLEAKNSLRLKRVQLTKADKRLKELKSNMAVEKDVQLKRIQKEDFEKTNEAIQSLTEEVEQLENKIEATKSSLLTYEKFLELFENMAENIANTKNMKQLDTILQKVFLNFTVTRKNVEEYTLCEPFASLERLNSQGDANCAR